FRADLFMRADTPVLGPGERDRLLAGFCFGTLRPDALPPRAPVGEVTVELGAPVVRATYEACAARARSLAALIAELAGRGLAADRVGWGIAHLKRIDRQLLGPDGSAPDPGQVRGFLADADARFDAFLLPKLIELGVVQAAG